jgi:hypothetical protein
MPVDDQRFNRVCSVVLLQNDDVPIKTVARIVAATLAELDRQAENASTGEAA